MAILIGVDEAGYGPHLGPLAVAATAWRVEPREAPGLNAAGERQKAEGPSPTTATLTRRRATRLRAVERDFDLYKRLRKAVVRSPAQCAKRVAIADSKALYKSGLGLGQLERGVLAALALVRGNGTLPANTRGDRRCAATALELIALTGADDGGRRLQCAWNFHDDLPLPVEVGAEALERAADLLHGACHSNGVALVAVRARLVFPEEFNGLVQHFGNKASALSHVTLELVRRLIDDLPAAEDEATPIVIYFDKHGGRNCYAALLQHHFAECWIQPRTESRAVSRYEWEHGAARVEAVFRVGCEELLPTALASMTAKYHRELAMRAFNAYWTERVPGLRPTAGYFGDSRRFKAEINAMQKELGIEDRVLWRCR